MKIAIVGCAHGELDKIYDAIEHVQTERNVKIDILLCCGDFQAVRNHGDLECMAVPPKYRQMNTFYKYYTGRLTSPVLTLFIGGNHEASNYLSELPYGGWVAPNIYFLGLGNVVRFGTLRIGGVSGIFKGQDYLKGHFERPPYSQDTIRSVYHVRNLEIFRLQQVTNSTIDVFLSHDWPRSIHGYGDEQYLFKRKPYFRDEAQRNILGSAPLLTLLNKLMPKYWFSAHMHVKFSAVYRNPQSTDDGRSTKFLALDKCLPRRDYLQILDLPGEPSEGETALRLRYDSEWLAVLRSTDHLLKTSRGTVYMPGPGSNERYDFRPTPSELAEVEKIFDNDFTIPNNYQPTATGHFDGAPKRFQTPSFHVNPQTEEFCNKLKITNLNAVLVQQGQKHDQSVGGATFYDEKPSYPLANPAEISLGEDDECCMSSFNHPNGGNKISSSMSSVEKFPPTETDNNPDEISISDDDDEGVANKIDTMTSSSIYNSFERKEYETDSQSGKIDRADDDSSKKLNQTDSGDKNSEITDPVFKRRNAAMYSSTKEDD